MNRYNPLTEPRILPTHGHGLKWQGKDGLHYESRVKFLPSGLREVWFDVSSWTGISIGAIHYYASLQAWSPDTWCVEESKIYACAGYGPERPEEELRRIDVKAERRISKVEKDGNGEVIGVIGDYTYRFNTPRDAFEGAVKMFRARFGDGWQLHYDGCFKGKDMSRHWPVEGLEDFDRFEINL